MNLFKIPLTVTYQAVLPFLNMSHAPSPQEKELIEKYLLIIKQKAQPQGLWQTFTRKESTPEKISLEKSPLLLEGSQTVQHFQGCPQITLLATTLGPQIDELLITLSPQKPAHALIADAVASTAIESFTSQLDQYLSTQIKRHGYFPTARFSPGYSDWPLHWQKEFLQSLPCAEIGLDLTPYYLLQPCKSITAALGWSTIPLERTYAPPTRKPCSHETACRHCRLADSCPDSLK